ncbi:hypothetical protein PUV47_03815 [Pseudovibrio exalbescens]|uniref:hypothetical protein n=1 Tax=Pseudovibrio exalbescens TaxID=197461 RepID=UPI0023659393|nr:hypothetical protein [Pseudovibrio exalbescens]MDD7909030.1 hypothetical protein [Pseudovibrio exalbescens]
MYVDGVYSKTGPQLDPDLKAQQNQSAASTAPDFTMDEFIDMINPLQHIPGVNTLYQGMTGDTASVRSRAIGSTLFGLIGGPLGMVGLMGANMVQMAMDGTLEQESQMATGADAVNQKLAALEGNAPPTAVAGVDYNQIGTNVPPLFGNVEMNQSLSSRAPEIPSVSEADLVAALSKNTSFSEPPNVTALANDPRNVFPEDVLRELQAKHLGNS